MLQKKKEIYDSISTYGLVKFAETGESSNSYQTYKIEIIEEYYENIIQVRALSSSKIFYVENPDGKGILTIGSFADGRIEGVLGYREDGKLVVVSSNLLPNS